MLFPTTHGEQHRAPTFHQAYSGRREKPLASRTSDLPLAQIAVAHAQFETIHPFVDGPAVSAGHW